MNQSTDKHWIPNKKERLWAMIALVITAVIAAYGLWQLFHTAPEIFRTRGFKETLQSYGSLARLAIFFVLAHYVILWILRKRLLNFSDVLKKAAVTLSRLVRMGHTPIAILGIGLIVLHVTAAFLYGIKFDFHNISGLLALAVLLPVPVSGLMRYRKLDRKWHLRLGLAFAVLFLLHAFI